MNREKNMLLPQEKIESKIYLIRGEKVMLDRDLAELYGVPTGTLNQAVKRNRSRFPRDFMFRLNKSESDSLRSQNVILKRGAHLKYLPYAFTEYGVAMLSGVLNSDRAIQVNIRIIRSWLLIGSFSNGWTSSRMANPGRVNRSIAFLRSFKIS